MRLLSPEAGTPERLDVFMARANAAYYANHDPFADFTTAPEIGQVFGELLGAWAVVAWESMGAPHPVQLIEAGPGRGTLMQDARRATSRVAPAFHAACQVRLLDFSNRLRAVQAERVPDATWHHTLDHVPPGPAILFANEFLDALPIRQFVRSDFGWTERHVQAGTFVCLPTPLPPDQGALHTGDCSKRPGCAPESNIQETSPASQAWVAELAKRLVREGGAALILDYGTAQTQPGDSLQALHRGKPADPLADPGSADLTAHVDFDALRAVAEGAGAACHGPVPQGSFLHALGLTARTARLIAANPHRAAELQEAASRLSAPARMGALFKALCITQPGLPTPYGFA